MNHTKTNSISLSDTPRQYVDDFFTRNKLTAPLASTVGEHRGSISTIIMPSKKYMKSILKKFPDIPHTIEQDIYVFATSDPKPYVNEAVDDVYQKFADILRDYIDNR